MKIGVDLIKVYVKVRREKNQDGENLLRVTTHKDKPKRYTFAVNARRRKTK